MKKVKVVYVGECSGVSIKELHISNQKRGEPFEVPEAWAKKRIELEPKRWKLFASEKKKAQTVAQEDK